MSNVMTRKHRSPLFAAVRILICILAVTTSAFAATTSDVVQDDENNEMRREAARTAARQLTDRDPLARQRAAEELAKLAAVEQRKLVEGYRLQEKNARVRLALDWALYRMGRAERLFAVVRALDSPSSEQSRSYLVQLDSPEPLYMFLDTARGRTLVGLLEVFARIGNADTLGRIKPLTNAIDPKIADAARFAEKEISRRLAQTPDTSSKATHQTPNTAPTSL